MFTTIISIFAYFQYKQKRKLYSHYLSINYKYFIALQAFHELSVLAKNLTPLSLIEKLKEWNTNKIHQKNMIQYKRNPCLRLYLWSIPLLNYKSLVKNKKKSHFYKITLCGECQHQLVPLSYRILFFRFPVNLSHN